MKQLQNIILLVLIPILSPWHIANHRYIYALTYCIYTYTHSSITTYSPLSGRGNCAGCECVWESPRHSLFLYPLSAGACCRSQYMCLSSPLQHYREKRGGESYKSKHDSYSLTMTSQPFSLPKCKVFILLLYIYIHVFSSYFKLSRKFTVYVNFDLRIHDLLS